MRIRISLILLIVAVGLICLPNPNFMPVPVSSATVDPSMACSSAASQAHAPRIPFTNQSYGKLPLSFEANTGQMDARVRFLSRGAGYGLYLTSNEIVLSLAGKPRAERESLDSLGNGNLPLRGTAVLRRIREKARNLAHAEVRLNFVGAASNPRIEGEHPSPTKSNYLAGTDPRKWHTNIPHYRKVRYRSIYPGIDAVLYGRQRELEYDLEVAPGADLGIIRLKLAGASRLWLNPEGDLIFETTLGCFRQQKPRIYQDFADGRRWIKGEYILEGKDQFRFAVSQWDSSRPLTIDPTLGYATYLGGSGDENIEGLAVDAQGNVYVTGSTNSSDFPTTTGAYKIQPDSSYPAFIAKIDPSGSTLIYSTYIGGQEAPGTSGIAVDSNGSAVVCGITFVNEGGINAYAAKLNPSGNKLVYSLDFGGSFDDIAYAVAVDGQGNAYLTGYTQSSDFPAIKAWQPARKGTMDAFVVKLSPTGEKLYSTFLGGSGSWDLGLSITADAAGNAYVTGETGSQDFPTTSGAYKTRMNSGVYLDIFVTKFDPSGHAPVYSTLLGVDAKSAGGIAIDAAGNAYITGTANSCDFSSVSAASQGIGNTAPFSTFAGIPEGRTGYGFGFEKGPVMAQERGYAGSGGALVAKLNSTGSAMVYGTCFGGTGKTGGKFVAVDPSGKAWVVGGTTASDFPTQEPIQKSLGSDYGVYRKPSGSDTWIPSRGGLPVEGVDRIVIGRSNPNFLYARLNSGSIYRASDGGITWKDVTANLPAGLSVVSLLVDYSDANTVYIGTGSGVYKTTDGGGTWRTANSGMPSGGLFDLTVAPGAIYASLWQGIAKSTDGGNTWAAVNNGLPYYPSENNRAVEIQTVTVDPGQPSTAYAFLASLSVGGFYKTTNGGASWTKVSSASMPSFIDRALVPPGEPNTIFALGKYHLWRTTDGGLNWTNLGVNASGLAIDPVSPTILYYCEYRGGGDEGVYKSTNRGTTWSPANTGIAGHGARCLVTHPTQSVVYVGLDLRADIYVAQLSSSGATLLFSTYLGGPDHDYGNGIAADRSGNVYVAGWTDRWDGLPVTSKALQKPFKGNGEGFVIKWEAAASPPPKTTLISPSGTISINKPTYSWNAVAGATYYQLWVNDSATQSKIKTWYTAADAGCESGAGTCSITPSTALANGAAQWWVQTWNPAGNGPWSDGLSFTVAASPGKAVLISPIGSIATQTPSYAWNAVASVTWYQIWVNDSATSGKIQAWYTAEQAGCVSDAGICSVTPASALTPGTAQWWIKTYNELGYGPWSDAMSFTMGSGGVPGKSTLISPTGVVTNTAPAYSWTAVSGATWYQLWISDGFGAPVIQSWFTAVQAGCAAGVGTCTVVPATTLSHGSYQWWVQTWNDSGYGPWSDSLSFSVQ